ncbi:putative maintenance of ploidy protein mob1 [Exophiala dermatitidis]
MYEFLNPSACPQPLSPHLTLKQSSSCITINSYTFHDNNGNNNSHDHNPTTHLTSSAVNGSPSRAAQLLRLGLSCSPPSATSCINQCPPSSNARTRGQFKPQRANKGTTSYQLRQFAEATLGSGSLRKAVKLPEGEDLNEWLAVNVVDFYNQINLLYGSITEFCSPQSCPEMKATDEFEYLWQDAATGYPKPTKMPAPEYIEHLMTWVQSNIDNEATFPSRIGVPFPKHFPSTVRQLFKRLYRVYAHIYCHHYQVIVHLGLEPHLNTSFKHYVLFIDEHGLEKGGGKDYWGPLGDLVDSMLKSD